MANREKPAQNQRPKRTERRGQGQSGYTAGRAEGDTAVEHRVDTHHVREPDPPVSAPAPGQPPSAEPASGKPAAGNSAPGVRGNPAVESGGLATDDRFTGRGGQVERDDPDGPDDIER